jgi:hypothetical protein
MPTLLEIADELYGLPIGGFVAARDARVVEVKPRHRELAGDIKALPKPAVAAWAVNLLVRRQPDLAAQLVAVGAALREAQASLDGDELRDLTKQRRQLTTAITVQARQLALVEGRRLTESVTLQVEETLTAAMLDGLAAAALISGQLVRPLAAAGVDAIDVAAALAVREAIGFNATPSARLEPGLRVVPDPKPDPSERRAARSRLVAAEKMLADAESAEQAARRSWDRLRARQLQTQAEIDQLLRKLADLQASADDVEVDVGIAEVAMAEAAAAVAAADRERKAAAEQIG